MGVGLVFFIVGLATVAKVILVLAWSGARDD